MSCTVENVLVSLAVLNTSVYNKQVNGNNGRFLLSDHIRSVIFHVAYV